MLTEQVTATETATDLKTLLEVAGVTFPSNGNDSCKRMMIQLDPTETNSVAVQSEGASGGIILANVGGNYPTCWDFDVDRISRVYLTGSAASVLVNIGIQ